MKETRWVHMTTSGAYIYQPHAPQLQRIRDPDGETRDRCGECGYRLLEIPVTTVRRTK
jgi:hypothetical protein